MTLRDVTTLPSFYAFVDRDGSGTIWYAMFREADDRWGITDVPPRIRYRSATKTYPPFDGPRLPTLPFIRLFVRGGRLGSEYVPLAEGVLDIDNAEIYARNKNNRHYLRITADDWDEPTDHIGYTPGDAE